MTVPSRALVLVLIANAACQESPRAPAQTDGGESSGGNDVEGMDARTETDAGADVRTDGAPDAGSPFRLVRVGTGQDRFEPVGAGQVLPIVLGPQGGDRMGGFHIFGGVETVGLDPAKMQLHFVLRLAGGSDVVSDISRKLTLAPTGSSHAAWAVPLVLSDCCAARGQTLDLRVEVEDGTGQRGEDEVQIVAGSVCSDGAGGDVCP